MDFHKASAATVLVTLAGSVPSERALAQSTEPFPAQFELSGLLPINGGDGSNGFVLNGIDENDWSGSVYLAGDVNGDGIDDLLIGAQFADPNGVGNAGECYVVYGGMGGGSAGVAELSSLDGSNGFVIQGIDTGDLQRSVSPAGDMNGDGFADLVIGAAWADPNEKTDAGECYVVFGGAGVGSAGVLELSSLNGPNGIVLNGIEAENFTGWSVSTAGDMNGDGFDDLIIGAPFANPNNRIEAGECYVVLGSADLGNGGTGTGGDFELSSLNGANGFVIIGSGRYDRSGNAVSSAGDINGDGFDDIVIGAYYGDPNLIGNSGKCYVVFGSADLGAGGTGTSGEFWLRTLSGTNGFVLHGIDANDRSGTNLSSAKDVNADGFDDLIISAPRADPHGMNEAGESYVVFGGLGIGSSGTIELAGLNGTNGFVINGAEPGDGSGFPVSSAGDVNADGINDLIIGASLADPNSIDGAGRTYVVFGDVDLGSTGVIELAVLDGTNGFTLNGIDPLDYSGNRVASAGDFNADGADDLVIGARRADPDGRVNAGETYVVFGRDLHPCTPDLNNDGVLDNGDIGEFVTRFSAFDLSADMNGDGILDNGDIGAFVAAFLAGC